MIDKYLNNIYFFNTSIMGNKQSIKKINFEDMQYYVSNKAVIINTMNEGFQHCLIKNTIRISDEERIINKLISDYNKGIVIIIYGLNPTDESIYEKYNQLINLGFYNIFVYTGGMFEWLLLQDVYGEDSFKTDGKELDILKYKGNSIRNNLLLKN